MEKEILDHSIRLLRMLKNKNKIEKRVAQEKSTRKAILVC